MFASIRTLEETRAWVNQTQQVIETLDGIRIALDEAETRQRGFIITASEESLGERFDAPRSAVQGLARLRTMVQDNPAQKNTLDTLDRIVSAKLERIARTIELRRSAGFEPSAAMIRAGTGRILMDSIRDAIATMKSREQLLLKNRTILEKRGLDRTRVATLVGLILASLLALFSVLLITRVMNALAQGRRSAAYARTLLDATSDGMYGLDHRGLITFANEAMGAQLGYTTEELIGQQSHKLIHHTRADGSPYPARECPMLRIIDEGGHGKLEDEIIWRKDGTSMPVEYVINHLLSESGKPGAVVSFRDISDRQLAEAALRKGKESAEAANKAKSDFLARMSHELRTPLNSVIGFANVMLRNKGGNLRDQDVSYLERIQKNGVNLLALINDILDLSKIEAGRMEVDFASVSLPALVQEVTALFEPLVATKQISLITSIPDTVAPLFTDYARLHQILVNLVGNAIKFTNNGDVQIRILTDPATDLPTSIEVCDSGIGIPADRMEAIFEAFEQAEKSTTRRYGGTGLGLPISRSLCHLLGFELNVKSVAGQGSTFTIDLQRRNRTSQPAIEVLPDPESDSAAPDLLLHGKHVLIIDDDADARTLIAHQIASLGGHSTGAASGEEGMQKARLLMPNLITLDLLMPGIDGWEILKRLKADPVLNAIPVVVISLVAKERGGGLIGALSVLPKPLDGLALSRALKRTSGLGKVLIVDDDVDTQHLLASFLFDEGASEVRVVQDGESAITAIAEFQPDLVLLDMVMPNGNGEMVLNSLAANPPEKPCSVIVVTSKELSSGEMQQLELAAVGVVRKGASLEERLRSTIRGLLGQKPKTPDAGATHVDD